MTADEIVSRVGRQRQRVLARIAALVADEMLTQHGAGGSDSPFMYTLAAGTGSGTERGR